jgi:hypothetical protein
VEQVKIGLPKAAFEAKSTHMDSVTKLQNLKRGGKIRILTETQEDQKLRVEVTESKD